MDTPEVATNSDDQENQLSQYQLKDMADTLMRAHEIQSDPELMKQLEPFLQKKEKAIKSIADLKRIAQEKSAEEDSEDPDAESEDSEAADS